MGCKQDSRSARRPTHRHSRNAEARRRRQHVLLRTERRRAYRLLLPRTRMAPAVDSEGVRKPTAPQSGRPLLLRGVHGGRQRGRGCRHSGERPGGGGHHRAQRNIAHHARVVRRTAIHGRRQAREGGEEEARSRRETLTLHRGHTTATPRRARHSHGQLAAHQQPTHRRRVHTLDYQRHAVPR